MKQLAPVTQRGKGREGKAQMAARALVSVGGFPRGGRSVYRTGGEGWWGGRSAFSGRSAGGAGWLEQKLRPRLRIGVRVPPVGGVNLGRSDRSDFEGWMKAKGARAGSGGVRWRC